jgi:hypothetical protein
VAFSYGNFKPTSHFISAAWNIESESGIKFISRYSLPFTQIVNQYDIQRGQATIISYYTTALENSFWTSKQQQSHREKIQTFSVSFPRSSKLEPSLFFQNN